MLCCRPRLRHPHPQEYVEHRERCWWQWRNRKLQDEKLLHTLGTDKAGKILPDEHDHEHSTCFNVLGKGQQGMAFAFFKPAELDGHTLNGERFFTEVTGSPLLENAAAWLDCRLQHVHECGDHSVFVGEVVGAGVRHTPEGRADDLTLTLKDLGDKVFYGG